VSKSQYFHAVEYIKSLDIIALDTEGNSLDPFDNDLMLIQLGDQHKVFIFDFTWFSQLKKENFWKNDRKLFIMHNAKYDYKMLKHVLNIEVETIFDTMLAERILTCGIERKNSLKEVVWKYLKLDLEKKIREDFLSLNYNNFKKQITKELLEYSARDVQLLPLIYEIQRTKLIDENLYQVALMEFKLVRVIAEMELTGIYINIKKWKQIIKQCHLKKDEITTKIAELLCNQNHSLFANISINLNSTMQLKNLFHDLGIELKSTGIEELKQVKHPLAELIVEYRNYQQQV